MPRKVAPLVRHANMPPKAPVRARPPPAVAPRGYSSFLDAVLDHVCCAAEADDDGDSSAREDLATPSGGQQARPCPQRSRPRHLSPPPRPRPSTDDDDDNLSPLDGNGEDERRGLPPRGPIRIRPELTILPHLRFRSLPSSSSSSMATPAASSSSPRPSSLRDFFDLFLADEAPHSFGEFHRSNGDDNVEVTPWVDAENDEPARDMAEVGRLERNITFRTKISPGSSSNPLSSQPNNGGGNITVIPLEVAVRQTLVKHPGTWTLECEFSFDFRSYAPTTSAKLGTGLGQYLMSNVVRGTTASVAVVLSEGESGGVVASDVPAGDGGDAMTGGDAGTAGAPSSASCHQGCHDGLMSCLMSHPLLLPPDGLCSSGGGRGGKGRGARGKGRRKRSKSNHDRGGPRRSLQSDEPSRVGASLLSAIKARNAPDDDGAEFDSAEEEGGDPPGISLLGCGTSNGPCGSMENVASGRRRRGRQEDVLCCTSRGAPKPKRIPSFEMLLSRAPSTVSMRRMILERDVGATFESSGAYPSPRRGGVPSDAVPIPVIATSHSRPRGLSMRIEMEVRGSSSSSSNNNNNNNNSSSSQSTSNSGNAAALGNSLSTSFSRSASLTAGIDDRVRRGLRKRVSRQWISWAEGWCMRLWEEERAVGGSTSARGRKDKGRPTTPARTGPNGSSRRNVRPSVRRIGDKRALAPKNVWEPLGVVKKGSGGYVGERWMSSELEGECGVEVSCTVLTPGRRGAGTIDDNHNPSKSRAIVRKPSIKGGRRLLKSLGAAS